MTTKSIIAAAALLLLSATASFADSRATVSHYDGTREELRVLCETSGATLTDRDDRTICIDSARGASRVCVDEEGCYAITDDDVLATGSVRDPNPMPGINLGPLDTMFPSH